MESPAAGELEVPRCAKVPAIDGENIPRAGFSGLLHG